MPIAGSVTGAVGFVGVVSIDIAIEKKVVFGIIIATDCHC